MDHYILEGGDQNVSRQTLFSVLSANNFIRLHLSGDNVFCFCKQFFSQDLLIPVSSKEIVVRHLQLVFYGVELEVVIIMQYNVLEWHAAKYPNFKKTFEEKFKFLTRSLSFEYKISFRFSSLLKAPELL